MSTAIGFTRYSVFGWVVHHKKIPAGEMYTINLTSNTDGPGLGNITIITKGQITGVNRATGTPVPTRVPGYSNKYRTGLLAGTYDFTALESSEWWCINQKVNKNQMPDVDIFVAAQGQAVELPVGTKLLLCEGKMSVGDSQYGASKAFQVSSQQTMFVADEQCYGFIFKE
jgi:hypothetical protein